MEAKAASIGFSRGFSPTESICDRARLSGKASDA